MRQLTNYMQEVTTELKKVSWPSREKTINLTLLVLGVSVVVAVYIGGLDFVFQKLVTNLILLGSTNCDIKLYTQKPFVSMDGI